MTGQYLADLDELVILCRTNESRKYISEALACYRAGAFRACIITTWIAVVFDFIDKLKELELTGDAKAAVKIQEFERKRANADIGGALDFERSVLETALKDFELLSPMEYVDLQRLLEDRNRCAHPSMRSSDEIYEPSAELARFHIRNAVTGLLQHPPVQGKAATERLIKEISSPYFPTNREDALKHFEQGPLARPRESLVRNFVIVLLKWLFGSVQDQRAERRYMAALMAVLQMHRVITQKTFAEKLNEIVRLAEDSRLLNVFSFLQEAPDAWEFLGNDSRGRLQNYVSATSIYTSPTFLSSAMDVIPLRAKALSRIETLTAEELSYFATFYPRKELLEPGIRLYEQSRNYDQANSLSKAIIIPLVQHLKHEHISRIFQAAIVNSQVLGSFELVNVLKAIQAAQIVSDTEFINYCTEFEARSGSRLNPEIRITVFPEDVTTDGDDEADIF